MNIVGVAMVRNEADIVETFVRYHLQFLDAMIITDHQSSDGSTKILEALAANDPRLHVLHERRSGLFQREVMTCMMRMAARKLNADWVAALDSDEFLATDSRMGVRQVIEKSSTKHTLRVPWRGYVPRPEDHFRSGNVLARVKFRRVREEKVVRKLLVPRRLAEKDTIEVGPGNHFLLDKSRTIRPKIRGVTSPDLFLGHFPIRSAAQVIRKAVIGWLGRIVVPEDARVVGYNKRPLFHRLKLGETLSADELMNMAFAYPSREAHCPPAGELVLAPIPCHEVTLRYENLIIGDPIHALASFAEALVRELSTRGAVEGRGLSSLPPQHEPKVSDPKPEHRGTGKWNRLGSWAVRRKA